VNYSDETYQRVMGFPPTRPAAERSQEERRASLEMFFSIMESLSDEELAENPLAGRPLNISILAHERVGESNAA
jgi:hypothetical protein